MGVLGLWQILESVGHPIKIDGLEGKRLGVDANIWLYKFIRGFREKDNATSIDSHKLGLFNRVCKLLFYKIRPVFVFDGPAPVLKRRTLERRQNVRNKNLTKMQTSAMKLLAEHLKEQYPGLDVKDVKIQLPEFRSNNLAAAEKLTDEDRTLFYLPPSVQEKHESSSDDEIEFESGRVDIHSEDFRQLPPEARYEILKEKRIRHAVSLPEDASDFSKFQLARLKARREIQEKIEECEKEICGSYTGEMTYRIQSDPNKFMVYARQQKELSQIQDQQQQHINPTQVSPSRLLAKKQNQQQQTSLSVSNRGSDSDTSNELICYNYNDRKPVPSSTNSPMSQVQQAAASQQLGLTPSDFELHLRRQAHSRTPSPSRRHEQQPPEYDASNLASTTNASATSPRRRVSPTISQKQQQQQQYQYQPPKSPEASALKQQQQPSVSPSSSGASNCQRRLPQIPPVAAVQAKAQASDQQQQQGHLLGSGSELATKTRSSDSNYPSNEPWCATASQAASSSSIVRPYPAGSSTLYMESPTSSSSVSSNSPTATSNLEQVEQQQQQQLRVQSHPMPASSTGGANLDAATASTTSAFLPSSLPPSFADNAVASAGHSAGSSKVTAKVVEEAKELLKLFGIPFIDAAGEAEAQCALLENLGLTEGTITDDSDIWLFGAKNVYRYFFSDDKWVMQYKMPDIEFHLRMTRENLVCFAMLVGSDYTDGISNVGPVTALEILSEFQGDEISPLLKYKEFVEEYKSQNGTKIITGSDIKKRKRLLKFDLPEEFPSSSVYDGYMRPVADTSSEEFSWGLPDLNQLREYARRNFGWDPKRIDEKLLPVMKKLSEKNSQPTIDSYFFKTAAQQNPELFRSKRVNDALKKISKQEDHEGKQEKKARKAPKRNGRVRAKTAETRSKRGSIKKSNQPVPEVVCLSETDEDDDEVLEC